MKTLCIQHRSTTAMVPDISQFQVDSVLDVPDSAGSAYGRLRLLSGDKTIGEFAWTSMDGWWFQEAKKAVAVSV